jgi:putative membrane protein insertion efficiency factor
MEKIRKKISAFLSVFLILLLNTYQYLFSPWIGQQCRFTPTCSHYAKTAIKECGILHGLYLAMRRLLRCHPWCEGGYDPVISPKTKQRID